MIAEQTVIDRKWTYTELQAIEDQRRRELYDGELVEMGSPNLRHQALILQLALMLNSWVRERNLGRIYLSPVDLYVSETKCYIPDLMFVRRERYATERIEREDDACVVAPPDLAVEIISPSTGRNDRFRKSNIYAEFGVQHYWIIDPEVEALQAFVLERGRYVMEASLTQEDTFRPSLFPDLQIPLNTLFSSD